GNRWINRPITSLIWRASSRVGVTTNAPTCRNAVTSSLDLLPASSPPHLYSNSLHYHPPSPWRRLPSGGKGRHHGNHLQTNDVTVSGG
ncbi:hypothetical protein COCON_G00171820, partial [Conger conger]